jgi:hypothetical protein
MTRLSSYVYISRQKSLLSTATYQSTVFIPLLLLGQARHQSQCERIQHAECILSSKDIHGGEPTVPLPIGSLDASINRELQVYLAYRKYVARICGPHGRQSLATIT